MIKISLAILLLFLIDPILTVLTTILRRDTKQKE